MLTIHSKIETLPIAGKRVFLRADLNVPLAAGTIISDFRLHAMVPTMKLLINKGASIIIGTHIGRPHGYDEASSTKHLLPWFSTQGFTTTFAPTLEEAQLLSQDLKPSQIILLENLRFDEREDQQNPTENKQPSHNTAGMRFARELRKLADYYVNDAFGVMHRFDTSLTLLPSLFKLGERTIGLLVEKEIHELNRLLEHKKFLLILAGGKAKDKLPYVELLLNSLEACILLPAVAFPFLKAQGIELGSAPRDEELILEAQRIMKLAKQAGVPLILPQDFLVALHTQLSKSGALQSVSQENGSENKIVWQIVDTITENDTLVASCGPKTVDTCKEIIERTPAVFINGLAGFFEEPATLEPFKTLLQSVAKSNALSIIGGGESVAAAYLYHLEKSLSFCSTGGGASLYYLAHKTLPALTYAD